MWYWETLWWGSVKNNSEGGLMNDRGNQYIPFTLFLIYKGEKNCIICKYCLRVIGNSGYLYDFYSWNNEAFSFWLHTHTHTHPVVFFHCFCYSVLQCFSPWFYHLISLWSIFDLALNWLKSFTGVKFFFFFYSISVLHTF